MMPNRFSDLLIHPNLWRFVGFGSSVVGFICFALSPSFHDLFGRWNLLKIASYTTLSFIFSVVMLSVNNCGQFLRAFFPKAHVGFLVLILTSLYSLYEEPKNGYRSKLSLISFGAFALMSVSLSRQIQPGFEVDMFNFFLGCLMVAVMKMNFKIAVGAAIFSYLLIFIRSYSYSQREQRAPDNILGVPEHVIIEIESQSHNQMQNLASNGHEEADTIDQIRNGDQETGNGINTEDSLAADTEQIEEDSIAVLSPRLRKIPSSFKSIDDLRVLDMSFTSIDALPDIVTNLKGLRRLNLKSCQRLRYLPSLATLRELEELDLSDTAITEVPAGLEMLPNLRVLNLNAPNLKLTESFATKLSNFPSLRVFEGPRNKSA